ncbi:PQQ-dependent sugar dehydrogenase [Pendulispora albinea]|uniref:PQQ-dependent sugar dehydrogenase n=1 Tax=Pendulispora albinea TaxID=2741071 RepID=A0ABZ2MAP6_9BACT
MDTQPYCMHLQATIVSLGLALALGAAATFSGCGNNGNSTNDGPRDGGGVDVDGAVRPQPARYGLDQRPANPTCKAPPRPPSTASVKLEQVYKNVQLDNPMTMAQIPGDPSRWYVAERSGKILSFPVQNPPDSPREDLNIANQITNLGSEGGLLGMAFHPNFSRNGYVYLSYTTGTEERIVSAIRRFTSAARDGTAFGAQADVLAFNQESSGNHKGGCVQFGPDGYLYASFGDGGGVGDPFFHGQETTSFFSKVLRIDIDHGDPYAIPDDNPFKNDTTGKKKEIFAYGFRNPFRFSFDRVSRELWLGDVGQDDWEEIDIVKNGGNYGWSLKEGTHCFPPSTTSCSSAGLIDPIYEYFNPPPPNGVGAVTGGRVYRGKAIPELVGSYLFGDSQTGEVWAMSIDPVSRKPSVTRIDDGSTGDTLTSFNEDLDGEIFVTALGNKVYKVVQNPTSEPPGAPFPEKLSQTGCVDPAQPKNPAPGLVPYGVNSPLWSDGADKERYLALPDTKKIHVQPDGDFDLPVGSVLVKTFTVSGKRIETRLFVRHDDGDWGGYSYEWNEEQTDATLLPSNKSKTVGHQTWYFPSRSDCMSCHSTVAGRTLGLEVGQLNGDFVYASTQRIANQLATFDHIGLFDAPLGRAPAELTRYPNPSQPGADLGDRAASYLHANCSFCHRPNGIGGGGTDFRYGTSLAHRRVCNENPENGDLGVPGAKIVTPGAPETSILSLRVHALDFRRMPPLATSLVDTADTSVLDAWIRSLPSCPKGDGGAD